MTTNILVRVALSCYILLRIEKNEAKNTHSKHETKPNTDPYQDEYADRVKQQQWNTPANEHKHTQIEHKFNQNKFKRHILTTHTHTHSEQIAKGEGVHLNH